MTLSALSDLAQIIGSVGVIFTLVFVALELRRNTALSYRNTFIKYLTGSKFYLNAWKQINTGLTPGFQKEINGILRKKGLLP